MCSEWRTDFKYNKDFIVYHHLCDILPFTEVLNKMLKNPL